MIFRFFSPNKLSDIFILFGLKSFTKTQKKINLCLLDYFLKISIQILRKYQKIIKRNVEQKHEIN